MPYDPKAVTEDDRSFAYRMLSLGLPSSLLLLASMQFEALSLFTVLCGGYVCGVFIAMAWSFSHDEFVREQLFFASSWALSFAGLALFVQIVPYGRDFDHDAGVILALMAGIFHAALAWRRWRDGEFAGGSV